MALWKDQYGREQNTPDPAPDKPAAAAPVNIESARQPAAAAQPRGDAKESLLAAGLTIEGKIDLHGRTQAQAHDDLHDFVARAHAAGKRMVLVITGKGMTASKSGVLKENVPRWLNEPGLRRHVLAFDYAEPQHGGEGALYVLLKRKKDDRA